MSTWIGIETETAWVVAIAAAAVGSWMIATGMLEELFVIVRRAVSPTDAPRSRRAR